MTSSPPWGPGKDDRQHKRQMFPSEFQWSRSRKAHEVIILKYLKCILTYTLIELRFQVHAENKYSDRTIASVKSKLITAPSLSPCWSTFGVSHTDSML